jgi:hypothetical protein
MTQRAAEARQLAETAFEQASAREMRDAMGQLSARLSYFEEDAILAIKDWKEFHADALRAFPLEDPNAGKN